METQSPRAGDPTVLWMAFKFHSEFRGSERRMAVGPARPAPLVFLTGHNRVPLVSSFLFWEVTFNNYTARYSTTDVTKLPLRRWGLVRRSECTKRCASGSGKAHEHPRPGSAARCRRSPQTLWVDFQGSIQGAKKKSREIDLVGDGDLPTANENCFSRMHMHRSPNPSYEPVEASVSFVSNGCACVVITWRGS